MKINYPMPENGIMFSPTEVWKILHFATEKFGKRAKRQIMNQMIDKKQVGVKNEKALYQIYNKKRSNDCPPYWNAKGRKRFVSVIGLSNFVHEKAKGGSITFGRHELSELVNRGKEQLFKSKGLAQTSSSCTASPNTHDRYKRETALMGVIQGDLSVCTSDNLTTEVRLVAGKSMRSVTSYIMSVCNSHFLIGDPPKDSPFAQLRDKLEVGALKTIYLLENALRVPVYPIRPENVLSTDDTTEYIFYGARNAKEPWKIVGLSARKNRGHNSFNHADPTNAKYGGFRIKIAVTISAAVQMARLVLVLSGLSEEELSMSQNEISNHRGMCVMKVEGLSLNGTVCPNSTDYGYIILMLKHSKSEEARHSFYDEIVLQEFIKANLLRQRSILGLPLDYPRNEDDSVATWRDGDISQLNALIKSGRLEDSSKEFVQYMKQSASRSKDEQAADKSPIFKIIHKLNKTFTSKDKPNSQIQSMVAHKLELDARIHLKSDNRKALLDFVGQIGAILIHAATPKNIKKGFVEIGMIDKETETCPDIDKMLATLTRELTVEDATLLENNFSQLLQIQIEAGHISDHDYDRLGFPDDIGSDGVITKRYSGHDSRKRACQLNHVLANRKRKENICHHHQIQYEKEMIVFHRVWKK